MFTIKRSIASITIGIVAFLLLEAYGFYSIRRTLDTRLSQLDSGIESVRAADTALTAQVQAQAATQIQASPIQAAPREPAGTKAKDLKRPAAKGSFVVNGKVAARLQKMLPARTSVNQASAGFKNQRDFISAVYVSKDLTIPFPRLKTKITGNHAVSIEAAIRELRPDLSKAKAKAAVEKGQRQAVEIAKLGKSGSSLT
ncbi:MAG TPA: hypothetical protein VGK48_06080 [Terriglobia bacterium]|jgi:hypothetical protein